MDGKRYLVMLYTLFGISDSCFSNYKKIKASYNFKNFYNKISKDQIYKNYKKNSIDSIFQKNLSKKRFYYGRGER